MQNPSGTLVSSSVEQVQHIPQWAEYYPPNQFIVSEETDVEVIAGLLGCQMSCCWGQGRIPDTDYYALACYSAQHKGDKRMVRLCHVNKVQEARTAIEKARGVSHD